MIPTQNASKTGQKQFSLVFQKSFERKDAPAFFSLFNKKVNSSESVCADYRFLNKTMEGILAGGTYGFVLGDGLASATAFIAQAYVNCKDKKPLLVFAQKERAQDFLLKLATRIAGVEITSQADFGKIPPNKQAEIEKELGGLVDVEYIENDISIEALANIINNFSKAKEMHIVCIVSYETLISKEYASTVCITPSKGVSVTMVCDVPWTLNGSTNKVKRANQGKNNHIISTHPGINNSSNVRLSFNVADYSKIVCMRAGPVTRGGMPYRYFWDMAIDAAEKKQSFVVDFFDEKTLWGKEFAKKRKKTCWFSNSKVFFTETKPKEQTFLPKQWRDIA